MGILQRFREADPGNIGLWIALAVLLTASAAAFMIVVYRAAKAIRISFTWGQKRIKRMSEHRKRPLQLRLMLATLALLASVWCLRFAVELFDLYACNTGIRTFGFFESLFSCLVHAMQTVSMDEDYAEYIAAGRNMVVWFLGNAKWAPALYGIYASVLNFITPLAGGAVLLELLSSVFPKLDLWVQRNFTRKEFCYFSQLNDRSLALAKSVFLERESPVQLVFADVLKDDVPEETRDLIDEAQLFSAICVRDDIVQIQFSRWYSNKKYLRLPLRFVRWLRTLLQRIFSKEPKCKFLRWARGFLLSGTRMPSVYLIDENENINLEDLTALLENDDPVLKTANIYVFQSDQKDSRFEEEVSYIVDQMYRALDADAKDKQAEAAAPGESAPPEASISEKSAEAASRTAANLENDAVSKSAGPTEKKPKKEKKNPAARPEFYLPNVIPVYSVRSMAINLMMQLPLFQPLVERKLSPDQSVPLHVVIFGSGVIGTEMFLAASWFGQMPDVELHITVVSKERQTTERKKDGAEEDTKTGVKPGEGSFEGRIRRLNPEILESGTENSDLLRTYPEGENLPEGAAGFNPPYFRYHYVETDVLLDDLEETLDFYGKAKGVPLTKADYYIVALGSDEDNFAVADRLRQIVGRQHLGNKDCGKTVISYVIYNSGLCAALNRNCRYNYAGGEVPDIYMRAFGSMEDVYSISSVMFNSIRTDAVALGEVYLRKHGAGKWSETLQEEKSPEEKAQEEKSKHADKLARAKDIYSYYADIARRAFRPYLVFSAKRLTGGRLYGSVFSEADEDRFDYCMKKAESEFEKYVFSEKKEDEGKETVLRRLAWLEHRRWCAFMRSKGFRHPEDRDLETFLPLSVHGHKPFNSKILPLKLHGCLVEADVGEISAKYDDCGLMIGETQERPKNDGPMDMLDRITYAVNKKERENGTKETELSFYKLWDYPQYGFSPQQMRRAMECCCSLPVFDAESVCLKPDAQDIHPIGGRFYVWPNAAAAAVLQMEAFKNAYKGKLPESDVKKAVRVDAAEFAEKRAAEAASAAEGEIPHGVWPGEEPRRGIPALTLPELEAFYEDRLGYYRSLPADAAAKKPEKHKG